MNQVLLIDSSVTEYEVFVNSVNDKTFPLVYTHGTTWTKINNILSEKFSSGIDRLAIAFHGQESAQFIENRDFFTFNEEYPYSFNVSSMINLITTFNIKNVDFLGCNTLQYESWKNYYSILENNTSTIVGASVDKTGNLKYGGDWVLENTEENVENIYFTENIKYYIYLLGGSNTSAVITSDDAVYICGDNYYGELGNGTNINSLFLTSMPLPDSKKPKSISCSSHTVVLFDDNTIYACGYNYHGQLGNGTNTNSNTLVQMILPTGKTAIAISTGSSHTVVLFDDNTIYTCGHGYYGQFGNGTNTKSNTLVQMILPTGKTAIAISTGSYHTVVLFDDNTIYACGDNFSGQLGNGTSAIFNSNTLIQMILPTGKTAIAISTWNHTVVLFDDNTIYACGFGYYGQFGNGTNIHDSYTLVQMILPTGKTAIAISTGYSHTVVLFDDNTVYACGYNYHGQLGNGTNTNSNTLVQMVLPAGKTITTISTGYSHTVVLFDDNTVYACGDNGSGQLSDGTYTTRTTLVQMLTNVSTPIENVLSLFSMTIKIEIPVSNVCFPIDTPINTDQGIVAIQKIDSKVHTIRGKQIKFITQTVSIDKFLVCFEKDCLGKNVPNEKTTMSMFHMIFHKGKFYQAKDFVELTGVSLVPYNGQVLYNVLLEEHGIMLVNNLLCETLHPENGIALFYKHLMLLNFTERNKLISNYNNFGLENGLIKQTIF